MAAEESTGINWRGKLEAVVEAPVEEVWEVTKDFVGIHKWAPSLVAASEWDGEDGQRDQRRRNWSLDGNPISVEKLVHMDPEAHQYSYAICHDRQPCSLLPGGGAGYVSTFSLSPFSSSNSSSNSSSDSSSTLVSWSYSIPPIPSSTPSDFQSLIFQFYRICLSDLSSYLASRTLP